MRGWPWDRPILVRELRAKAREGRLFAAFGAYVALVALLTAGAVGWVNVKFGPLSPGRAPEEARLALLLAAFGPGVLVALFLAPVLGAVTVARERERGTFDLLVLAGLSGWAVVLDGALAAWAVCNLFLLASLPASMVLCFWGLLSPWEAVAPALALSAASLSYAAFGVLASTLFSRPLWAVLFSLTFPLVVNGWETSKAVLMAGTFQLSTLIANLGAISAIGAMVSAPRWEDLFGHKAPLIVPSVAFSLLSLALFSSLAANALRREFGPARWATRVTVPLWFVGVGLCLLYTSPSPRDRG